MQKKTILIVSLFLSSQLFCPPGELTVEESPRSDNHIELVTKPRNWWQKIIDFIKPKKPRNSSAGNKGKNPTSLSPQNSPVSIDEPAEEENNSLSPEEKEKLLKELSDQAFSSPKNFGEDPLTSKLTQEQITEKLQKKEELKEIVSTSEQVEQLFKQNPKSLTSKVNELYEQFKKARIALVDATIHENSNTEELLELEKAFNTALENLLIKAFDPIKNLKMALDLNGSEGYIEQFKTELLESNFVQISDTSPQTQALYREFTQALQQAKDSFSATGAPSKSSLETTKIFITLEKAKEALLKGIAESSHSKAANKNWEKFNKTLKTIQKKAKELLGIYKKRIDEEGKASNMVIETNLNTLIKLNPNTLTIEESRNLLDGSFNTLITALKASINMLRSKEDDEKISIETKVAKDQLTLLTESNLFTKTQIHNIMPMDDLYAAENEVAKKLRQQAITQIQSLTPDQRSQINRWIAQKKFPNSNTETNMPDFLESFSKRAKNVRELTLQATVRDITLINEAGDTLSPKFKIKYNENESEA